MDSAELDEWVERCAMALAMQDDLDLIGAELRAQGCSSLFVDRLLLLIPSAFAAAYYVPLGIDFPAEFWTGEPDDLLKKRYVDEPTYLGALRLAQRWQQEGALSLIGRVLDWSAEARGIREAQAQGLTPTRTGLVYHRFADAS